MTPAAGPAARRLARQRGLDLQRVHGSGHRGRITVEDVAQDLPARPAASAVTARADLSDLLDRLPALASLSGRHAPPLTPLLIKAAAVALRVSPDLAPLSVSKGTERWALDHGAAAGSLGVAPLARAMPQFAAPQFAAPPARGAGRRGASLRLDGPVRGAAYHDGAVCARSYLHVTVECQADAEPFVRALVALLETPDLVFAA